jgi:hypothetical protein
MRRNWVGLMFCALGLVMVIAFPFAWRENRSYRAAAACPPSAPRSDCRATLTAEVLEVEERSSRSPSRKVSFLIYEGPVALADASFPGRKLGPSAVRAGQSVSVEVWDKKVTKMIIDGEAHRSFRAQAAPWWLVPAGLGLAALGVVMILMGAAGTYVMPRHRNRSRPR